MSKKVDLVLKEVIDDISVEKEVYLEMKKELDAFLKNLNSEIKKKNISAEVFVGGSFAKKTLIQKDVYDADVFVRFDKRYKRDELSLILEKLLREVCKKNFVSLIHGSRDYFKVFLKKYFYLEIVPVRKIKSVKEYENITDLSYLHVKYLKKKIKSDKILDEIRLAKAFVFFSGCYGAESYISGFSGYSIELLVLYYGGFENFLKGMLKIKDKEVIDIEKMYKNRREVLMNLNSSKLSSPVILIDPTYKQRNALAALSNECFEKFRDYARSFLKNPSKEYFKHKKIDLDKIKEKAKEEKKEFFSIEIFTEKQEGDIAGSKLLKFYKNFIKEVSRFYFVFDSDFKYFGEKKANFYVVLKKRDSIVFSGPKVDDEVSLKEFKKAHENFEIKNGRAFATEKFNLGFEEFLKIWKKKNSKKMKDMYIEKLEILK